ncbi:hypothetical protein ACFU98_37450 [Streptomyces sp. NPDC057575]|uniref:hypothetical protein n=1 Tax=unclassified Streptomyces TaxID=2593676 RepID=UPI0036BE30FB
MSGRGRRASLPPADHSAPEPLADGGLVVRHVNKRNRGKEYDFSTLPVTEPMQRSLAVLFAACCTPHRWTSHLTSKMNWKQLVLFATFLSQQERPPRDLDELTGALVNRWRQSLSKTTGGYNAFTCVVRLLKDDARLQSGPVAEALARRTQKPKSRTQSYSEAEFDVIKAAARRMFRAALLRINENARHLERWRDGDIAEGCDGWVLGEALDAVARTGDVPRNRDRDIPARLRRVLGGGRSEHTWQRLFLSRMEAGALGVLLLAEHGWNLSVIDRAVVARASPDPGEDGHPTYSIPVEKRRRGAGLYYETRNVTDHGADSRGRLITQALQATRFARAIVEELAPGTDLMVVWRTSRPQQRASEDHDRQPRVGAFEFGVSTDTAKEWARNQGFPGSPFQRGRRTVVAVDRREPTQHSQDTHDRSYALVDQRVQAEAVEVIAAGAEDAARRARAAVLVAQVRDQPMPDEVETATADCSDFEHGPYPAPDGGCGASFLMCLACENASIHPGHHPRLVHLHQALANLRSVLPPPTWHEDWGDAHARLEDLKGTLGDGTWTQVSAYT